MADKKITDMTALAAGSQATGDLITVVDVSEAAAADKNKKMTMENLFKGIPGQLFIGRSSSLDVGGFQPQIQVSGTDASSASIMAGRFSNNGGTPFIILHKSRGTNTSTNTVVQSGDIVGRIAFYGADGSDYEEAGNIECVIDGEPVTSGDTTDMPGRLQFATTDDGAGDATVKMVIKSGGNVGIGTTAPATKLEVEGSGVQIRCQLSSSKGVSLYGGTSSNTPAITYDDTLRFFDNDTGAGERLRIGGSGQIGLGGANYGTSGQVLTSNGASAAPTWQDAGGGLSSPLTANLDVGGFDIISSSNGNIDLSANGTGLIRVTENSLSQVPIVTQHDIGTASNEIPLNQYLGTAAFQDSTSFSVGDLTVTGAITLAGSSNASGIASSDLDDYEEGSWTPTDASGGSQNALTTSGRYTKIGNLLFCTFDITYPTTADGNTAQIGGLPFNGTQTNLQGSGSIAWTNFGSAITFYMGSNMSSFGFNLLSNTSQTGRTNANMSGKRVIGSITFRTA